MSDTVPIMLSRGVSYLSREMVERYGVDKLQAINNGGIVVTDSTLGTLTKIRCDELFIDHDFNHRGTVAPIDVIDLAKSIEKDGLQSPIIVQPWTDKNDPKIRFKVVAGHRRSMAVKRILKRETIDGFIRVYKNQLEAQTASLIENLQRQDLNIKQEAHAIKAYDDAYWSEQEIADHLSQSRGWVKIRLQLLTLCDKVQDYAAAGLLTQEHIRHLQGKSESFQLEFVREVKEQKAKGEKLVIEKPVKKINPHVLKPRGREETFEKITELYGIFGEMGLWARCMSWCAGQITEYELMRDVERMAKEEGLNYRIPAAMLAAKLA
jgi:ParB/RepB/Spo0J family partition protein